MRLPAWLRRRSREKGGDVPTATAPPPATPSDETLRAQQAAREAAVHLRASRARRPEVDEQAKTIRRLNQENGFAKLIREALGRNA